MAQYVYPFQQYYLSPLASSGNDASSTSSSGSTSSLSSQEVNVGENMSQSVFGIISGQVSDLSRRMANAESAIIDLQNTAVRTGSDAVLKSLSANTISLTGGISANNANFGGWNIRDGKIYSVRLEIDSNNECIKSTNFLSGSRGFYISPDYIEADNIYARGTIGGATFKYDVISAVGGQLMVANSDVLDLDTTQLDNAQFTFKGNTTFAVNDILVCRCANASGIQEEWVRVTNISNAPRYVVTRDIKGDFAANANPNWPAGTTFVKQGSSDGASTYSGGWLKLIGEGTHAPYYSVFTRTGVAYNAFLETVRMGNLNGIGGNTSDVYGFFAGNSSQYFMWDGSEISATGFSLNILRTAGETITGATTPAPVYIRENVDIASRPIMQNRDLANVRIMYGNNWFYYSFRLDMYTNNITKFRVRLGKNYSPTGNVVVALYAADANFKPTGSAIETSTKACSSITNDAYGWSWNEFDFSNNNDLTPNGLYCLVLSCPNGDVTNNIQYQTGTTWEYMYVAGGGSSTDGGSTWSSVSSGETPVAITYGSYDSTQTNGRVYLSKSNDLNKILFSGFAVTTASVGEEITVQTDGIVNGFTGLTAGAKYFIQDDGTIGTSVGTYDRYVGYALTTTTLYIDKNDFNFGFRPSDIEKIGLNNERSVDAPDTTKVKDTTMYYGGKVLVRWDMKCAVDAAARGTVQLYINGVAAGFPWYIDQRTNYGYLTFGMYGTTYATVYERIDVLPGDKLQLYVTTDLQRIYVKNFKVYFEFGTLDYKKNVD